MCKEQEYFCIRRGLFKKKVVFWTRRKNGNFLSANSKSMYYIVKKQKTKKNQKQGFRVIYINVEILHYFLI